MVVSKRIGEVKGGLIPPLFFYILSCLYIIYLVYLQQNIIKMAKRITTEEFINKAHEIYGNLYDYSKKIGRASCRERV